MIALRSEYIRANTYDLDDIPTEVSSIMFSSDSSVFLASTGNEHTIENVVWLWRVEDGGLIHTIEGNDQVSITIPQRREGAYHTVFASRIDHASFSRSGRFVACTCGNTFSVWSTDAPLAAPATFVWGGRESRLVYERQIVSPTPGKRWEAERMIPTPDEGLLWQPAPTIWTTSWSADDALLATAGSDSAVRIWDAASGKLQMTLAGHTGAVRSALFSHDGATLLSTGSDVRLWDVASGACRAVLNGHSMPAHTGVWRADDRQFVTLGMDGRMCLWDAATYEAQVVDMARVTDLAFSPDGSYFATVFQKELAIWRTSTLERLCSVAVTSPHPGLDWNLFVVAWSHDGQHIAAGGANSFAGLWRVLW